MCPKRSTTSDEKRLRLRGLASVAEVLEAAVHEARGTRSEALPAIKFSNGPSKTTLREGEGVYSNDAIL